MRGALVALIALIALAVAVFYLDPWMHERRRTGMDSETLKPILAGLVRHALTTLGGALVAGGYMQGSEVPALVGGGMVLAGALWSWWQKEGQKRVVAALAKMHPVAAEGASETAAAKAGLEAAKEALK